MSVIPFTTQIGPQATTQGSQGYLKMVIVHTEKMTERQSALISECQNYLTQYLGIKKTQASELHTLPTGMKYFVIPCPKDELIKKIKSHFEKPVIYLPRAVIEARAYLQVPLPSRNLAISMTMYDCRVFLVPSCDLPAIKNRIFEMSGSFARRFSEDNPNVVVTDTAINKYCSKAFKRNIPVVSRNWVDENYYAACEEERDFFQRKAIANIADYQIKPFFGLHFKILHNSPRIKKMITDNQGHIIYGNENCLTHIVAPEGYRMNDNDDSTVSGKESEQKPRIVDEDFLNTCVELGYYVTKKEYLEIKMTSNVIIKQEFPPPSMQPPLKAENATSKLITRNGYNERTIENRTILQPPQVPLTPKQNQQQHQSTCTDTMNDMILKALSTFETAQTQLASTQMRRLPDQELRIEQTYEPSQQLYWNDSVSRRG